MKNTVFVRLSYLFFGVSSKHLLQHMEHKSTALRGMLKKQKLVCHWSTLDFADFWRIGIWWIFVSFRKPPTLAGPEIFSFLLESWRKIPCRSKDHWINSLLEKNIVLVGIYDQHFQGIIALMVFDFQGIYWFLFIHTVRPTLSRHMQGSKMVETYHLKLDRARQPTSPPKKIKKTVAPFSNKSQMADFCLDHEQLTAQVHWMGNVIVSTVSLKSSFSCFKGGTWGQNQPSIAWVPCGSFLGWRCQKRWGLFDSKISKSSNIYGIHTIYDQEI